MAKFTVRSFAQSLVRQYGTGSPIVERWNGLAASDRKQQVAAENRRLSLVGKKKASTRKRSTSSRQAAGDAFTRQGRMSSADWNATFHS